MKHEMLFVCRTVYTSWQAGSKDICRSVTNPVALWERLTSAAPVGCWWAMTHSATFGLSALVNGPKTPFWITQKKLKSGVFGSIVIVLTDADTLFHQLKTIKANLKASRSSIRPSILFALSSCRGGLVHAGLEKKEQRVLPKFPHLSSYFKMPHFRHCGGIVLTLRGAIFPKLN